VSFSWAKWFAVAVLLAAPLGAFANSDHIVGGATIIDGDTIKIHDQRIRLHGVDAPESAQECRRSDGSRWRCGQQATLALQDLIGRRPVTCARQNTDRYRRIVAKCSVGDTDINAWLVTNGWAVAYRRYSSDHVGAETMARAGTRGIWSGEFAMPWEWRRDKRSSTRVHEERHGGLPAR
jgi:endonuclease YncB( thermonuclease family)